MLTLYIACLVFGGVLLAISMFSGGDGDADTGHAAGSGADLGHDLDAGASSDPHLVGGRDFSATHDVTAGGDLPAHPAADAPGHAHFGHDAGVAHPSGGDPQAQLADDGGALATAMQFFSFRNMVYLTTFFGLTGTLLTIGGTGAGLTLAASATLGAFAAAVGH